jgi:hypothetical protein
MAVTHTIHDGRVSAYAPPMRSRRTRRLAAVAVLVLGCLFYLQFGLQALAHHLPQGILALVGATALGWGAVRSGRGRQAASVVFLGTVPVLVLHAAVTLEDPGELPFFIGSVPAPTVAAIAWGLRRRPSHVARPGDVDRRP